MKENEKPHDPVREAKRDYYRAWRARNREKIKAYNARYWEKQAEKRKERKQDDTRNEKHC